MLLGYNTNGFTSHALEDALRVIAGLGYESVAITLDHAALDPYAQGLDGRVERCAAQLRELELVPVIETGARFLLDPWRKHRPTLLEDESAGRERRIDFLERAVDVAVGLGAGVVSLWSGAAPEESSAAGEELDERLAAGLRRVARYADARGISIGFEPEPGMHVETMPHYERVSALVDHAAFQLTLDVGHAHLTEEEGAEATVRRFADQIVNVHLEGMRRPVHEHLLPWEGDLDLRATLRALEGAGYAGPATFELSRHSHAAVAVARRALAFARS